MTDTEASKPKTGRSPEKQAQHLIARALSKIDAEGTAEELKQRYEEGKAKFTAEAKKIVKALTKGGVSFQHDASKTKKAKRAAKKASEGGEGSTEA